MDSWSSRDGLPLFAADIDDPGKDAVVENGASVLYGLLAQVVENQADGGDFNRMRCSRVWSVKHGNQLWQHLFNWSGPKSIRIYHNKVSFEM